MSMLLRRIARPLLSAAFIGQGVEALLDIKPAADAVQPALEGLQALPDPIATKMPGNAVTAARIAAGVQIGGGILLATGRIPRLASALLAATVIPANLGEHMFWTERDPVRKADKRRAFLTDVSLVGGLLLASADTAGKPSLAWRGRRAGQRVVEAVSAALPATDDTPLESELVDKIGQGLQVGVDRSREFASAAIEKGIPIAEAARRRGTELAEVAREQGSEQLAAGWHRLRAQR